MSIENSKAFKILSEQSSTEYAKEILELTINEIEEVNYDPEESQEIWLSNTGLEPDYLLEILI